MYIGDIPASRLIRYKRMTSRYTRLVAPKIKWKDQNFRDNRFFFLLDFFVAGLTLTSTRCIVSVEARVGRPDDCGRSSSPSGLYESVTSLLVFRVDLLVPAEGLVRSTNSDNCEPLGGGEEAGFLERVEAAGASDSSVLVF